MKKVSIIVPVFNAGEYIEECLNAILNQSLDDIEIICVNDGSIDGSLEILRKYEKEHDNIKVRDQVNQGPSVSRNRAFDVAEGKYIYCMDSDDMITSHMIVELWNICEEKNLDILYFSGTSFYENEELEKTHSAFVNSYHRKGEYTKVLSGPELFSKLHDNEDYYPSPCLQFIRKGLLEETGIRFQEHIIHEDNSFTFMTLLSAKRAFCVNDIYFYRRVRNDSIMTKSESCANLRGYFVSLMKQMEFVSALNITDVEINKKITLTLRLLNNHVNRIFPQLSKDEKDRFYQLCTPYERYFFDSVMLTNIKGNRRRDKDIEKLKAELDRVKKSNSYKIGRIATYPVRLAKRGWRCLRKNGFSYTCKQVVKKIRKKLK